MRGGGAGTSAGKGEDRVWLKRRRGCRGRDQPFALQRVALLPPVRQGHASQAAYRVHIPKQVWVGRRGRPPSVHFVQPFWRGRARIGAAVHQPAPFQHGGDELCNGMVCTKYARLMGQGLDTNLSENFLPCGTPHPWPRSLSLRVNVHTCTEEALARRLPRVEDGPRHPCIGKRLSDHRLCVRQHCHLRGL